MVKSSKMQVLVDQGFLTGEMAEYLEASFDKKVNVIIAGHRGHGIIPLLATCMTCIDKNDMKMVKNVEADLAADVSYYVLGDLKDVDFGKVLTKIFTEKTGSVIAIKDPEHGYSLMKILRDVYNANNDSKKEYIMVECKKIGETKKVGKITHFELGEKGKVVKKDIFNELTAE